MKKIVFKNISIVLILAHFFVICLRDISFAQEINSSGVDFEKLGKIPDTVGHGVPSGSAPMGSRTMNRMAAAAEAGSFFQKDIHTPSDKFNRILESVSPDSFTGKAQLSIPIFVPSGKRDLAPPLNISYQSSSGNSIVGVGWSLDLGTIARSAKRGVPKYDTSDIFLAQGQELVSIGNNEFRNKIEGNFMKYIFDGTSWVVTDKSGTKYYFGSTDNSRLTISKGTYAWPLDKIVDLKGNSLSINYFKEENVIYPLTIYYTANEAAGLLSKYKISFSYENRPDTLINYIIGESVKMLKRLQAIEISFDDKLMREYIFEYTQSSSTQKSLLSKVTEYGADGVTASPPITFAYRTNTGSWSADQTKWHIPDGDFVKSGKDQGRRLYDLNGDGMFDFVISRYDINESSSRQWLRQTYLNSKDGFSSSPNWWPVPMGYFTYNDASGSRDDGRRLVDLTGDGIPELLAATLWDPYNGSSGQYKNAYVFQYLDQTNPRWAQDTRYNLPDGYFVYGNKADGGKRFADLNGDGLNDLSVAVDEMRWSNRPLDVASRSVNTYINTGSGWQQDSRWHSPDGYYSTASGDGGKRLVDINGDGLADFLVACDGNKATYLNNGSGWMRNDSFNIPDGNFAEGGRDQGRMLVDINGDGLPDLVIARAGYRAVYINTGSGWKRDDSFNIPDGDFVDSDGQDQGRYLADLDGDGVIDIGIAKDGDKKAYLNLTGVPDLLIGVSNGLGGKADIEYAPSTAFDNYYPNKTGRLPFAVQVVSRLTADDGQGNSYSTAYSYKSGYFDASDREFRGFGYVKVTDAKGNYKESYFLQDDIYKGRLRKQEVRDLSGNLLAKTEYAWKSTQPYSGINFPYLAQTDSFVYDSANQNNYKQTQLKYEYDSYGNPAKVISYGDVNLAADDKTQITEYVYNASNWIISLPKHTYLQDAQGKKVSEKWFYYDKHSSTDDSPEAGLLTKEESWLYNPINLTEGKIARQYSYDQYGNIISVTDALGRTVTATYDTACYAYPIRVTNALGQSIQTVYYGINEPNNDNIAGSGLTGQVKFIQDSNNQRTYNIYDSLGRIVKIIWPNDSESYPGVSYEYNLSARPGKITKKVKSNYNNPADYLATYQFSDGMGRVIEIKSPAENNPQTRQPRQIISGIVQYDERGQVKEKYAPYFVDYSEDYAASTYSTPHSSFVYDPVGRLTRANNPDLTYSTITYPLWNKTITDENQRPKTEYYDAYGRIIKIEEHNGTQIYNTLYEYDALGNLTKVTDNQNNITQIWYDSLGRKIKMNDPDMGIWAYEYDKAGNLIKQTDAKGQALEFIYDSINRLTQKKANGQTIVSYNYDNNGKQNCIGRLSDISDQSGSTDFYYDNLGREIKSAKSVAGSGSYAVERTYDALDRLNTLKYPDNSIIQYEYNPQGIAKVIDVTNSSEYISDIDYSPTGQITRIQYGNGTETNYAYDPNTLRLSNLNTQSPFGKIQDLSYQFDKAGNVTQLTDYVNSATQSFTYDDLNRLINATGAYGSFNYGYDSIGNMTFKEGVNLVYGKNGKLPHAVTQFGSTQVIYDANGNMSTKGSLQLTYDVENRLIKTETKSTTPVAQTVSIGLTLNPGWNFVSFPVIPQDMKVSSVLSSIAGSVEQVSRYNPTTKEFEHYVGNSKYDQFTTFDYGRGYQIFISGSSPVNLNVTGTLPLSNSVSLSAGTNLIFAPKNEEVAVENALSPLKLGVNYSKVLYYNKQGAFQEYSSAKKEFTTLKPGAAYYLYTLKASTWAITNPPLSSAATFIYDGDGGRVKKTASSGSTIYIGSLFEKDSSGKSVKNIFCGSSRICAVDSTGAKSFYHSDHLGSSNVVTDVSGKQAGLTEFTPYGSISKQTGSYDPKYKFTGKELDNTGLYFYGARYYDPELGRFITADSIVQAPYDPQSLNRYAYCRNNPINYIDPTGNFWFIPFIIAAVKGAIIGAAIGAAVAAATGGNIWQGMLTGAISGAIFGGIGSLPLKGAGHTLAHTLGGAASGAANGAITGGDIGMNALIGGLSAGASERLGNFGPLRDVAGTSLGAHLTNMLRRAFIGSVIGGSTSAAMGGSFGRGAALGAQTSAIAYATNEAWHKGEELAGQAVEALNAEAGKNVKAGFDGLNQVNKMAAIKRDINYLKDFFAIESQVSAKTPEGSYADINLYTNNVTSEVKFWSFKNEQVWYDPKSTTVIPYRVYGSMHTEPAQTQIRNSQSIYINDK